MNKTLKYSLIGAGLLATVGIVYLVTRKKDESGDVSKTDEKAEEKKEEEKAHTDTSPSTETKPKTETKPATETKPKTETKPIVNTDKLKGFGVSSILSKVTNPSFLKGKVVSSSKDATVLMGAKGNKLFTLKKDTIVGKFTSSMLTKKGDYLVGVKMNDGKSVLVNGANLKFV